MSKLLSRFDELNEELKTTWETTGKEMRAVFRRIENECWQPDTGEANHFQFRKEAFRFADLLEQHGYDRLFVRAVEDSYVIMRVVDKGVIHFYTDPKEESE